MCGEHSGVVPSESYLGLTVKRIVFAVSLNLQQRAQALERELALRDSEVRFRLLVEAVQDYAIFMLDAEGNVSSWNIGAERLKGYKAERDHGPALFLLLSGRRYTKRQAAV